MSDNDLTFNDNAFMAFDDEQNDILDVDKRVDAVMNQQPEKPLTQHIDELNAQPKEKPGSESANSEVIEAVAKQGESIDKLINALARGNQQPAQEKPVEQKATPKSIEEALGLPEDFVYDEAEAVKDPNSDSGRYLNARIAIQARRMQEAQDAKNREIEAERDFNMQKQNLMQKYNLDENKYAEFEQKMESYNLTLEDMFLILNRSALSENISRSTAKQFTNQRAHMANFTPNLTGRGGVQAVRKSDAQIVEEMMGIDNSLFETTV